MTLLATLNLGIRFLLELCLLAALGYSGFQMESWPLRWLAGLGAPLLAAVIWGTFVAPKAGHLLPEPARFGVEMALFALGGLALFAAGRPQLAAALIFLFLVNRLLLTISGGMALQDSLGK